MTIQEIHKKAVELVDELDRQSADNQLWLAWWKFEQGLVNIKKKLNDEKSNDLVKEPRSEQGNS